MNLKKILMVEDELDIQAIAKIALEMIGHFEVQMCSSGTHALEVAPLYKPQLILLDVMMPGMDGPNTLAALRKLPDLADIPVIFMTAKVQKHELEGYQALGALSVIAKPFDPMTLSRKGVDRRIRRGVRI